MKSPWPKSIFLCGFMGVGKSVVGEALSRQLGLLFVDTDQLIRARTGKAVAQIFKEEGEARFRQLESQVIESLQQRGPAVVALGGGALKGNLALLKPGVLVYLKASVENLVARLERQTGERPLLAGLSGQALKNRVQSLLDERQSLYEQADFQVVTDGRDIPAIAEEIKVLYLRQQS